MYRFPILSVSCLLAAALLPPSLFPAELPKSFPDIAKAADAARAADRLTDAVRLYQSGLKLRPSWGEGWWSLGSLLYDQDRFPEAEDAFRHFARLTPKPGPAYAFLGLCEYETHEYDQALNDFRAWARAGWPGTPELIDVAVFHFALLLTREGRFIEALYLLAAEAAKTGGTPALAEAMGLASLGMRNLPEDYPPEKREMVWLTGEAAMYAAQNPNDFARADSYADRLLKYYGNQPATHYFRGTLFGFESKKIESANEYREELRRFPQNTSAMLALADLDIGENQLAEALSLARHSSEVEPQNAEAHHVLGRVLMASGRLEESAKELETAKHLDPDSATTHSHLAAVYGRLGRTKEAKAEAAAYLVLKKQEGVLAPLKTAKAAAEAGRKP